MIERIGRSLGGVSFQRGVALGALIGAAIAGSTIWSRLRVGRDKAKTVELPLGAPGERGQG